MDVEARSFASFPHWLLEARRFAFFFHPNSNIYIYCGRGSETFRFLPPLVVGSETFRFLPPLVVGSETFRFLPPLVVGSETFRFFHPNNNIYIVGVEARRFASTRQFSFASARTIMERTTRFQKHIMFEGILSHIMLNTAFPYSVYD